MRFRLFLLWFTAAFAVSPCTFAQSSFGPEISAEDFSQHLQGLAVTEPTGHRFGDYADALAKGHTVILLVTESTGAFSADLDRVLRQLARTARASGSIDHTPYGTSRASTRSHYTFHSAAISAAIVTADALTIQNSAAALGFELTLDPRDLARRSSGRPPLRSAPPPPPAPPAATPPRGRRRDRPHHPSPTPP